MSNINDDKDSIPDGYIKHLKDTKKFIQELETEEILSERRDNITNIKNRMALDKNGTEIQKTRLINQLKNGLGEKIKENPNEVIIIKRSWYQKLGVTIRKILSKI